MDSTDVLYLVLLFLFLAASAFFSSAETAFISLRKTQVKHMVETKVVGLYSGRKVMSPQRWGPVGEQHRVIQPPNPDCQCPPRRCRCMETISIERVADEVISSLENCSA